MQQYLDLLQAIKKSGTVKPPARPNMPGSTSLFGYQFRHNLADGFPLLTTKKLYWKGIVTELLWFLRGDTNIKYLIDNGANFWNQDAYNYYIKMVDKLEDIGETEYTFEEFINTIKRGERLSIGGYPESEYKLGDCGYQYGKVWRNWGTFRHTQTDQIANVIKSLKTNPESRRHIVTAVDPAHDQDLALYWCHSMFQFNCRPVPHQQRQLLGGHPTEDYNLDKVLNVPKYYLDCQLYQRSADVVLGVPFNIASYSLLTHILCKICNMIPGDFVHTFGDVHIYDNHWDAVNEQLTRIPTDLPKLTLVTCAEVDWTTASIDEILQSIEGFETDTFHLYGYNPQPAINAKLSTGLK